MDLNTKLQDIDYKLNNENYILQTERFVMVERATKEPDVLVKKIFKAKIGANIFEVGYTLKIKEIYVGISSGKFAKLYKNGERMPGIKPIINRQVLEALRTLPEEIQRWIPDLNE